MTSEEIKNDRKLDSQYFWIWLKEIAYQLAIMNERESSLFESVPKPSDEEVIRQGKTLFKALGSTVPLGSETEVRGRCIECGHVHQQSGHCGAPIKLWKGYDPNMATWDECGCFSGPARPAGGSPTPDLAAEPDSNLTKLLSPLLERLP